MNRKGLLLVLIAVVLMTLLAIYLETTSNTHNYNNLTRQEYRQLLNEGKERK